MKIQLLEGGYEKMTGHFGHVYFENGVSVDDVSEADARLFASITPIAVVGEGKIVGDNERYQGAMDVAAVSVNYPTLADLQRGEAAQVAEKPVVAQVAVAEVKRYTKEELEAIADKKGIAGLREIGDPLGVKGTGVLKLIEAILAKQAPVQPEAAPLAEGQPDVVTFEKAE